MRAPTSASANGGVQSARTKMPVAPRRLHRRHLDRTSTISPSGSVITPPLLIPSSWLRRGSSTALRRRAAVHEPQNGLGVRPELSVPGVGLGSFLALPERPPTPARAPLLPGGRGGGWLSARQAGPARGFPAG